MLPSVDICPMPHHELLQHLGFPKVNVALIGTHGAIIEPYMFSSPPVGIIDSSAELNRRHRQWYTPCFESIYDVPIIFDTHNPEVRSIPSKIQFWIRRRRDRKTGRSSMIDRATG